MTIGELVGRGRTSDVYAYGNDSVVKVPHEDVPADWPGFEATLTQAVHEWGIAAPEVRGLVDIDGRSSVIFERIAGPSMWQQMLDDPSAAPSLARDLASIQKGLVAAGMPRGIPELVDRLVLKIQMATGLIDADRSEAVSLTKDLPRGAALLHGDLHPGNVLMSSAGPVVIDWFDATIGHPVADIVRSSILMQPSVTAAPQHLPDASPDLLSAIHRAYLGEFQTELSGVEPELAAWQAVVAAGRLAEGAEADEGGLIALWSARPTEAALPQR